MNKYQKEKEELNKASDFLFELDKSGHKYSCYGREIYIRDNVFRVIDKLQKENQELKEDNSHQWEERCRLTFELEKLKEENQKLKECHFKYEEMTGTDLLLGE